MMNTSKSKSRVTGNTFPVKDRLKALGAKWNPAERAWFIEPDLLAEAQEIVSSIIRAVNPEPVPVNPAVNWSDEQKAIFNWFALGRGNLVVQARAGTGKTTTIKEAFSYAPERGKLLYAVFNKKNQVEAAAKISDPRVEVRTLHSLGKYFINLVWQNSQPSDDVEFDRIRAFVPKAPDDVISAIERLVAFSKNLVVGVPELNAVVEIADSRNIFVGGELEKEWPVSRLAQIAIEVLKLSLVRDEQNRHSFNDQVWLPVAAGWVRPIFSLVVVDEAQDMNLSQLTMAIQSCVVGGRICIVGDNRQAIYGFRGAASDGMHLMKVRLEAAELGLTTTYRCPKAVVAIAKEIVPDYCAAPSAPDGEVLDLCIDEALKKLEVNDAVVSRLNAPLMGICLQLLRNGVPARIEGRDVGKQLVAQVKKFKANSVPDFLERLAAWRDKQVKRILASGGKNVDKKAELINDQALTLETVAQDCTSVNHIVEKITSLFEDSDKARKPAVVCSSVHKAKGLEWKRVCLLMETFRNKGTEGEEANIYYVAVTRAKQTLIRAV